MSPPSSSENDRPPRRRSRPTRVAGAEPASGASSGRGRLSQLPSIAARAARIGGWILDVRSRTVEWSPEMYDLLDWSGTEPPSLADGLALYAPASRAAVTAALDRACEVGEAFDLELEMLSFRGRVMRVRAVAEVVLTPDGAPERVVGAFQDITALHQSRAEALELAERLSLTLDAMSDAFLTVDTEWRFAYLNAHAEALVGRSRESLIGRYIWDEFPDGIGSPFQIAYERAMAEQVAVEFEAYYPAPLDKWFVVKAYPSSQGLAIYFRDVTTLRAAAEAIRTSEERFRVLSRATTDAIWDWDLATDALWWNDSYASRFGLRSGDATDATRSGWMTRIHPDDREAVSQAIQAVLDHGGSSWTHQYRLRGGGGREYVVLDRAEVVRDTGGTAVRMIGGLTDITEQLRRDATIAEHAALLDQTQDAILVRSLDNRVQYWNRGAEQIYGWTAEEAVGRPVAELLYDDPEPLYRATAEVLTAGTWSGELLHRTRDGRRVTMFVRWSLLRHADGRPRAILAINTDITERRRIEQQFLRSQRMESIGTLAGGIAHDLNNVLAPILMSIEVLKRDERDPERLATLGAIESSAQRGAAMVRQVLTFARGIDGERVELAVAPLLEDVMRIVNDTFLKSIEVHCEIGPDIWTVRGDPTQLHQALLNLCVNARDAMPQGGRLDLRATNLTLDAQYAVGSPDATVGPYVMFEVEDTGIGMSAETLERIFEPFFTTKPPGEGTGLGLSSTLAIVRSHGGFVRAYSEPGRGSRVRIHLPALTAASPAASDAPTDGLPRGHGELILVVDDEPSVLQITQETLAAFGYRVLTAADGAEAVSLYAQRRGEIALVLTDMMMPVMDGLATVQVLRRIDAGVRIIAASGLQTDDRRAQIAAAGVRFQLSKPFTAEVLLRTIRLALRDVTD